jgi:hypothetical protein
VLRGCPCLTQGLGHGSSAAAGLADARGESVPFSIVPHRGDLVDEEVLAVEAAAAGRDRRLVEDMGDPLWVPRVPR